MKMDVRPLLTESDLDWALAEIEVYFRNQPEMGSPEAARYNVLAALIENYEDRHWPIEPHPAARRERKARRYEYVERKGSSRLLGSKVGHHAM